MSVRFQRLAIILLSLIFISTAVLLILLNSKKNLVFFFTPSELIESNTQINDAVRIGGFVKEGSLISEEKNYYEFIVTDNKKDLHVNYMGLLPDLFREKQGVVIEGKLIKNNLIRATIVFAKHDENYIPASIKKQLQDNQYWKREYE